MTKFLKNARLEYNPFKSRDGVVLAGDGGRFPTTLKITRDGKAVRTYSLRGKFDLILIPRALLSTAPIVHSLSQDVLEEIEKSEGSLVAVLVDGKGRPAAAGVIDAPKAKIVREEPDFLDDLKAYETPKKTKSLLFGLSVLLGSRAILERFERFFASRKKDTVEKTLKSIGITPEAFLGVEKLYRAAGKTPSALAPYFEHLKKQGVKPAPLKEVIRQLGQIKSAAVVPSAVFVDYQAGSGDLTEIFKDYGYPAVLTGYEIRQMENSDPENRVIYGTDFLSVYPELVEAKEEYASLKRAVYFLNPPYTSNRLFEKLTVNAVPEGAPLVGVFPTAVKEFLKENITGFIFTVPAQEVGYDPKITPELLIVVGVKGGGPVQEVEVSRLEEIPEKVLSARGLLAARLKEAFSGALSYGRTDYVPNVLAKAAAKGRELAEFLKNRDEVDVSAVLYTRALLKGKRLLPDFRFAGDKPMMNLREAVSNVPYLSYLKDAYPAVYREVVKLAQEAGLPVPEFSERKVEYTTTENLGIVKLRYYPKVLKAEERVKDALLELLEEEGRAEEGELRLLRELFESGKVKKIVVKASVGSKSFGGEVNVGTTPVLTADDELGRELAVVRVNLSDFYARLEEKGAVNPRERYRVAEPDAQFKVRFLLAFYQHLKSLADGFGLKGDVFRKRLAQYFEVLKNGEVVLEDGKRYDLGSFLLKVAQDDSTLLESFTRRFLSVIDPEKEVSARVNQLLASRGVNLNLSKEIKEVVGVYRKSPYEFFTENKKEAEELIREALKKALEKSGEEKRKGLLSDLEMAVWDGLAVHYSAFDRVAEGSSVLLQVLFEKELILRALKEKKVDKAYETFRTIMKKTCGIKEHQLGEAVRLLYKVEKTGEKGHLLGWEMRSGKTLAMALAGYFYAVLKGSDAYLMPRSANVNDVIYQILARAPFIAPHVIGYEVSTVSVALPEEYKRAVIAPREKLFPNLFGILSASRKKGVKEFVLGGGEKIEELRRSYALEMERLIEIAEKKLKNESLDALAEGRFSFVKQMDAYNEPARLALYWYLNRLEAKGLINPDGLPAVREALIEHSDRLKKALEADGKKKDPEGFAFRIVPKSRLSQLSYEIEVGEKKIPAGAAAAVWTSANDVRPGEEETARSLSEAVRRALKEDFPVLFEHQVELARESFKNAGVEAEVVLKEVVGTEGERPLYRAEFELLNQEQEEEFKKVKKELEERYSLSSLIARYYGLAVSSPKELAASPASLTVRLKGVFGARKAEDGKGEEYFYRPLSVSRIDEDEPVKDRVEEAVLTFNLNFTSRGLTAEAVRDDGLPPAVAGNESGSPQYFVRKDFEEGRNPAVIVDEVDEAANPASSTYRALFAFSRKGGLRIGATGTPTSGYPETVMSLMGVISDLPLPAVESSINKIIENYSVYAVREGEKNKLPFVFITALFESGAEEREHLIGILKESDSAQEFISSLKRFLEAEGKDYLLTVLDRYQATVSEKTASQHFTGFKETVLRGEKKSKLRLKPETAEKFFTAAVKGYVKRVPGTFDPVGFVSALSGASLSLNTRENLKKEFLGREVEEKIEFDLEGMETALSLKGAPVSEDCFAEGTAEIRELVDVHIPEYVSENKLSEVYEVLSQAAKLLYDKIRKKPGPFLRKYGIDLSEKEAKILLSRSRSSVADGVYDLFLEAVKNNWTVKADADERKLQLLKAFAEEVLGAYAGAVGLEKEGRVESPAGYAVKLPPAPPVNPTALRLSTEIEFESPAWQVLKEDGVLRSDYRLSFTYYYLSDRSLEAVDSLTNRGYSEKNAELASSRSYLLTSSRVIPLTAYLLDAVAEAYRSRKEGSNPYGSTQILVRVSDPRIKEAVNALDREKLEEAGIFVRTFTDNASLDAESQKWKKVNANASSPEDRAQLIVAAMDETIARGVDLSHLDEILYAGVNQSGKTASQLFARLFSVERNEGKVNVFGLPVSIALWRNGEVLSPSMEFYKTKTTYEKNRFIREVISGKLASVAAEAGRAVEFAKELFRGRDDDCDWSPA